MTALATAAGAATVGSSPTPLAPVGVIGRGCLDGVGDVVGRFLGDGQGVVEGGGREGLALGAELHAFDQCLADSGADGPMNLTLYHHGVDHGAAVVDSGVVQHLDVTGIPVNLYHCDVGREGVGVVVGNCQG